MRKIGFTTEVPTAYLDELTPLIDMHFCIATECVKDAKYFEWYRKHSKDVPILLDNGMFEEGKPMPAKELAEVAKAIRPTAVFAPDMVGDRLLTRSMSYEFINLMKGSEIPIGLIPQGVDPLDVAECYVDFVGLSHSRCLGGPIGLSFLNDRDRVVEEIKKTFGGFNTLAWHHWLGLYSIDEIKRWPKGVVDTMDTVKPFKAAWHGYEVENVPRGLGKWNTQMKLQGDGRTLLYRNIACIHRALTSPGL